MRLLVTMIYYELSNDVPYKELGENFFDRLNQRRLEKNLVRRLEGLGFRVELQPEGNLQTS